MKYCVCVWVMCFAATTLGRANEPLRLYGITIERIVGGQFDGVVKLNEAAAGANHYFTAHGLLAVATDRSWAQVVESHLDFHLSHVHPIHGWIDDLADLEGGSKLSDSDDSYVAMFLLLAADFAKTDRGKVWWQENQTAVKDLADKVLLANQMSSGLISVYSKQRNFSDAQAYPNMTDKDRNFKIQMQSDAFLMDSCETYAGLNALAVQLQQLKDSSAVKYADAARKVSAGIAGMFYQEKQAFYFLKSDQQGFPDFYPERVTKFYPHRSAQAWPQLFAVPLGTPQQTQEMYDGAWRYLNANNDEWAKGNVRDDSLGGFPWMSLGYVAAIRGETAMAEQQLQWHCSMLDDPVDSIKYPFHYIHEIGYAHRTASLLGLESGCE